MTLVVNRADSGSPQTHVLVIGVGSYDHLPDGRLYDERPAALSIGLGQLTSPVFSAATIAEWFEAEYNNVSAPLGTIELLTSRGSHMDIDSRSVAVGQPNFENIRCATRDWYRRCARPGNVAAFYFCGHGLETSDLILLPSDFGADLLDPWAQSINFTRFYNNMRTCSADQQWYFVDACREFSRSALDHEPASASSLIGISRPFFKRNAPVFSGSTHGGKAYGDQSSPSFFSQGVITSLRGMGTRRKSDPGPWVVNVASLEEGLREYLTRIVKPRETVIDFSRSGESPMVLGDAAFHQLQDELAPQVPLTVTCSPESALARTSFEIRPLASGEVKSRGPEPAPWLIDLSAGVYEIEARAAKTSAANTVSVNPPALTVELRFP